MKKPVPNEKKGGMPDPVQLEKKMVSGRVPRYVIEYAKTRELSISDLIMAGFDRYRETDVDHAFERLSYHEDRVIHWRRIVLQAESECNTKQAFCNTIKATFIEQGRGRPEQKHLDMNWLSLRVQKLQAEGVAVTVDELYEFCLKEVTP